MENLRDEHEKNIRTITNAWAQDIKQTEADIKAKLDEENRKWNEKLKSLEVEKDAKLAATL